MMAMMSSLFSVQAQNYTTGEFSFQSDGTPAMAGQATQDHFFVRNENGTASAENTIFLPDKNTHLVWFYLDDDEIYKNDEVQSLTPSAYNKDGDLYSEITYNSFQFNLYLPQGISLASIDSYSNVVAYEKGDRMPNTSILNCSKRSETKVIDNVVYDSYGVTCYNPNGYGSHLSGKDAEHYQRDGALKKDATLFALYFKNTRSGSRIPDIIVANQLLNCQ